MADYVSGEFSNNHSSATAEDTSSGIGRKLERPVWCNPVSLAVGFGVEGHA